MLTSFIQGSHIHLYANTLVGVQRTMEHPALHNSTPQAHYTVKHALTILHHTHSLEVVEKGGSGKGSNGVWLAIVSTDETNCPSLQISRACMLIE